MVRKSYLMVVETHDAAMIRTLTSPVAANRLAAGASFVHENDLPGCVKPCCCRPACRRRLFWVQMVTQDSTSPLAADELAAGVLFFVFFLLMATKDLTSPVAANQLAADVFFVVENAHPGFDALLL